MMRRMMMQYRVTTNIYSGGMDRPSVFGPLPVPFDRDEIFFSEGETVDFYSDGEPGDGTVWVKLTPHIEELLDEAECGMHKPAIHLPLSWLEVLDEG
jgi:hypothetical protein